MDNTDEQNLSLSGTTLSIVNGNSVDLSSLTFSGKPGKDIDIQTDGTIDIEPELNYVEGINTQSTVTNFYMKFDNQPFFYVSKYSTASLKIGNNAFTSGSGSRNTYIGSYSGNGVTSSHDNIAMGYYTLSGNGVNKNNIAIGNQSMGNVQNGSENNVAVGRTSMYNNQGGSENVAIGAFSMSWSPHVYGNTAIGYNSGSYASGWNNVIIGHTAGFRSNGHHNVFIGNEAGRDVTGNNQLYIDNGQSSKGALIYGHFTHRYVGINTTSPTHTLSVNGTAGKPGGGTWATFSDRRMKKDVKPFKNGLETVLQIQPKFFKYNGKGAYEEDGKEYIGIIAQDIQKVAPYMVETVEGKLNSQDEQPTKLLQYDPSALVYILVNAVKEQQQQITSLENRLRRLEQKEASLEAKLKEVNQLKDRLTKVESLLNASSN